ncbi:MAG: hypothetical protein KJO93_10910, partial [Muriicola sp.]|nr:hypothetical protein [Muriicola sp.]
LCVLYNKNAMKGGLAPSRSLKNPYFSVSGKNLGKVQKIIGERHKPLKPHTEKRGRLSAEILF